MLRFEIVFFLEQTNESHTYTILAYSSAYNLLSDPRYTLPTKIYHTPSSVWSKTILITVSVEVKGQGRANLLLKGFTSYIDWGAINIWRQCTWLIRYHLYNGRNGNNIKIVRNTPSKIFYSQNSFNGQNNILPISKHLSSVKSGL